MGDYGIAGFSDREIPAFIVEPASPDDLVQSLTHETGVLGALRAAQGGGATEQFARIAEDYLP